MCKKKILIYAHYYAPDVASTGQILQDQAEGMKDKFDVTVICTVPSYTGKIDQKYKEKKIYREQINGVDVIRVPVPEFSKSRKISRIKNLIAYYLNARVATRRIGCFDYVLSISQPPIMGGMLGLYGKKVIRTLDGEHPKFIYSIQDFNPEQIEATGYLKFSPLMSVARWLDNRSCKGSDIVITVGRDLVDTLEKRFKGKKVPNHTMINNWIDDKVIFPLESEDPGVIEFKKKYDLEDSFIIMYSGNIGLYYDLEGLIKVIGRFKNAKTSDGRNVVFAFVGAGSVLDSLKNYKKEHNLENVVFIPYQEKDKLIFSLNAADVHWCVNAKGIKGVSCPSKFYGIAGVGKPVLAVLEKGSEIQMLIDEIGCGRVSEPGDYESAAKNISWFLSNTGNGVLEEMGMRGYEYLIKNLTKDASISKYIDAINSL